MTSNGAIDTDADVGSGGIKRRLDGGLGAHVQHADAVHYSDTGGYTDSTPDIGSLGAVAGANDTLSGSLTDSGGQRHGADHHPRLLQQHPLWAAWAPSMA